MPNPTFPTINTINPTTPLTLIGSETIGSNSRAVSWSPNGNYVAVGNLDSNTVQIFSVNYVNPEVDAAIALDIYNASNIDLENTLTILNNAGSYRINDVSNQKTIIINEQSRRTIIDSAITLNVSSATDSVLASTLTTLDNAINELFFKKIVKLL